MLDRPLLETGLLVHNIAKAWLIENVEECRSKVEERLPILLYELPQNSWMGLSQLAKHVNANFQCSDVQRWMPKLKKAFQRK